MNLDEQFKHKFAFMVLIITVVWALICLLVTGYALVIKSTGGILAAAGVDTLLGALIVWTGNIVQFYFRKAPNLPTPNNTKSKDPPNG